MITIANTVKGRKLKEVSMDKSNFTEICSIKNYAKKFRINLYNYSFTMQAEVLIAFSIKIMMKCGR